ncbi:raftlin [Trichomycterus rosablanca]|uniref:raftlin n=1 Tax=Trichomycterus rosablanca TaxID=2290929 RepID=UPI002F35B2F7
MDGTSTLCLSSVRELPSQLQDLYQQGYVLTVVHPFVHPCGPEVASIQRQLYRAVLSKLPESCEKSQAEFEPYHLKLEECLSADHVPTPEHIQGYVKKQIQDAADQGIIFAGFVQEPAGLHPRVTIRGGGREASLSLHSSPSSLRGSEITASPSHLGESGAEDWAGEGETDEPRTSGDAGGDTLSDGMSTFSKSECCDGKDDAPSPINNKAKNGELNEKDSRPCLTKRGAELFGLFNYPNGQQHPRKYYTVKVPLRVQAGEEGSCSIEAHWLDHMTQHFNSGASLVDGYFNLGKDDDQLPKFIDSVFIFQEGEPNTNTPYDAIVVEQWTVINGIQVKTDYIPLLQSLASFGWRLTCVLPTPIVKTGSDGSVSTKQIVFLQRPTLPLKKRQSKKLIFRTRGKSGKNSVKDALRSKKKKATAEKELDDLKIQDEVIREAKDNEDERRADDGTGDAESDVNQHQREVMMEEENEEPEDVQAETKREKRDVHGSDGIEEAHPDSIETDNEVEDDLNTEAMAKLEETSHLHNGIEEQDQSAHERTSTLKIGEQVAIVVDISNQVNQE